MNRAIKSLNFLAVIILIAVILGCNSDGGGQGATQALTENAFANDPTLRADPEKHLIVHFLEHPDSEKPENDTGEVGSDIIPYRYKEDLNHTYCFEDDNDDAEHFAILFDSDGNEVLRVEANGECVTEFIPKGVYFLEITHDGKIEETLPLFAIPQQNGEQAATSTDGLIKNGRVLLSNILQNLYDTITQNVKAQQTVAKNVRTLLSTNACVNCDLAGADLTGADLTGADLTGAVLTEANLTGANLTEANLTEANLTEANLTEANLTGANLTEANLTGTTWCDGSICSAESIGTCETGARFMDNCNGTISDTDTLLVWEKKVDGPAGSCLDDDLLHSVDAKCNWNDATSNLQGGWLYKLNNTCNNDPTVDCSAEGDADCTIAGVGSCCGFACNRNWRLPEMPASCFGLGEFSALIDDTQGACAGESGACIDPIFGPTESGLYWSGTTHEDDPPDACAALSDADFGDASMNKTTSAFFVRAVLTGP